MKPLSTPPTTDAQSGEDTRAESSALQEHSVAAPSPAATISSGRAQAPVVCQGCGAIKVRDGLWTRAPFATPRSVIPISHGLCPDCCSAQRVVSVTALATALAATQHDTLASLRALIALQSQHGYPQLDEYTDAVHAICKQTTDFSHHLQSLILTLSLAQTTR
jgi:hypothetical protein